MRSEGDVLVQQLSELLADRIVDADGAMELATVAGLASRLGVSSPILDRAETWCRGSGASLLLDGLSAVDLDILVEELELVVGANAPAREIEDALFDVDEVLAAAVWAGQGAAVQEAGHAIAALVANAPSLFAEMAAEASELVRTESVSSEAGIYAYWYAIAELDEGDEAF